MSPWNLRLADSVESVTVSSPLCVGTGEAGVQGRRGEGGGEGMGKEGGRDGEGGSNRWGRRRGRDGEGEGERW